jgi:sugar phosphate permease
VCSSIFLVSAWYKRYEVQKRLAVYFLGSLFIQGFSNIFAYGLVQIGDYTTYKGWRWIYIIEGAITVFLGIMAYFWLIDFPDSIRTKFLTEKEKAFVNDRLAQERGTDEHHRVTWKSMREDLKDWKVWACAWIYFSATIGTYALGFFLPIILKRSLGFSTAAAFCLAGARDTFAVVVSFTLSWLSDRVRMRGPFVTGQAVTSIIGLGLLAWTSSPASRLVGAFLGTAGSNAIIPSALAWQANNCREGRKRSVASALQVMHGATGGLVASYILRQQVSASGYSSP